MTRKHKLWALMPALPKDLLVASVRQYAEAGAEWISVGALTHSVTAADFSLRLQAE